MTKLPIPIALAILSLFAAAPAFADSSADAVGWLDKLSAATEQGAFSVNLDGEVGMAQMGQDVTAKLAGAMTRKDEKHLRMQMKVKIAMSGTEMEMSMLSVADGSTLWTEMENPMFGGKQVMKIGLDRIDALRESGQLAAAPGGSDPLGEIRALQDKFDFEVETLADDLVTLTGKPKPETVEQLGEELADTSVRLVLGRETGFPVEMTMGGERPVMTMRFSDFTRLDETQLPADTFSYAPPDGVQVMDLGGMVGEQ